MPVVANHSHQDEERGGQLSPERALRSGFNPGRVARQTLQAAADVVDGDTVTIGSTTFEFDVISTDTTENVSGGDLNITTDPVNVTIASHGLSVGAMIRVESEFMVVTAVIDVNNVTVSRGASGSTPATHADATDIFRGEVAPSNVIVGVLAAALTAADWTDALIADINDADRSSEDVLAVDIGADEVLIVAADAPGGNPLIGAVALATTETFTNGNNDFGAATMTGGRAATLQTLVAQSRVPNANEIALANMHFMFDFVPIVIAIQVRVTATGIVKAWNGGFTITGSRVTLDNDGATDFAVTDTVTLVVAAAWGAENGRSDAGAIHPRTTRLAGAQTGN